MSSEKKISPFHGVANIVRFNWPIYVFVIVGLCFLGLLILYLELTPTIKMILTGLIAGTAGFTILTLLVSWYIYDVSELNTYNWLERIKIPQQGNFANIHSGFDETSEPLKKRFPVANWTLCDFYNPDYNTEGSILRARKRYPCLSETIVIDHKDWKLQQNGYDTLFCIFSVHEIRSLQEKKKFFEQSALHLKSGGKLVMAEHQRDLPNFLVFGHGAFHFFSFSHWKEAIGSIPSLHITEVFKVTPFIKIFVVEKK